jgi:hypothetical protein
MNGQLTLRTQCEIWKAKAETWEKAFNTLAQHGTNKTEETKRKINLASANEGAEQAELFLNNNNINEIEKQLAGGQVGVQNAALAWFGNWVREKVVETIVTFLIRVAKENAVNVFNWLLEQAEDRIIEGYMRLDNENKEMLKSQLKEHSRFINLLKKIEERENQG